MSKTSRSPGPDTGKDAQDNVDTNSPSAHPPGRHRTNADCLSESMLESHPMFVTDAERIDSVLVSGTPIEPYRGLSAEELNDLAIQNDSAAMAVLGAVSMLQAMGLDEQLAVPYLLFEDGARHAFWEPPPGDPETRRHLTEARQWFYKAALHGRLLALSWVGEVDARLAGGAVGLGWIGESAFEDLTIAERSALMPQNVYNLLAFEIAPGLRGGAMEVLYELIPKHERQAPIIERLATQFDQDRVAANLPPVQVPESQLPPWQAIIDMLCEKPPDLNQ